MANKNYEDGVEIKVNGTTYTVYSVEEENQLRQEVKDLEKSGNQSSSTESATVEQSNQAPIEQVNQPQNNQQKNTESNLVTGSSEPVSNHRWLQYSTEDGSTTIKPFFDSKEDSAIKQLSNAYPGFKFEKTNIFERLDVKSGKQVIKVTSPDGKKSTKVPIGLSSLLYTAKDFEYDNAYKQLTSFIDNNSTDESNKKAAEERLKRIDDFRKFNNTVKYTEEEKINIENDYLDWDGEIRKIKDDLFKPVTKTIYNEDAFSYKYSSRGQIKSSETTVQPYEKELKESRNILIKKGIENPTTEDIHNEAVKILINDRLDKITQKNTEDILDKQERKGTRLPGDIKESIILPQEEYTLPTNWDKDKLLLATKEFERETNAKQLIKQNLENELYDGEENLTTRLTVLKDRIQDEDYTFDYEIYGEDKIVELEGGRLVPLGAIEEYQTLLKSYEDKTEKIENIRLNLVENSHQIESTEQQLDLLRRNYNGLEEFVVDTGLGMFEMAMGVSYGSNRFFLGKHKFSDDAYLEIKDKTSKIRENYKKDVEFDDAFKSVSNFGSFAIQELANQLPIFVSLAMPGGIGYIGAQSFGDQYSNLIREDRTPLGRKTSQTKKWFSSLGFAAAETVFEYATTMPLIRGAKKAFSNSATKNQLFADSASKYFKNNASKALVFEPVKESTSEGLTAITQNLIDGKPITDNLAHGMFSGLMFGKTLSSIPFYKGLYVSQFSDFETTSQVRSRVEEMKKLETFNEKIRRGISVYGKSKLGTEQDIKDNESKIKELQKLNEADYKKIEDKVKTLTPKASKLFIDIKNRQQQIRLEADKIENSSFTKENI